MPSGLLPSFAIVASHPTVSGSAPLSPGGSSPCNCGGKLGIVCSFLRGSTEPDDPPLAPKLDCADAVETTINNAIEKNDRIFIDMANNYYSKIRNFRDDPIKKISSLLSFPRKREPRTHYFLKVWIPAFAEMTSTLWELKLSHIQKPRPHKPPRHSANASRPASESRSRNRRAKSLPRSRR